MAPWRQSDGNLCQQGDPILSVQPKPTAHKIVAIVEGGFGENHMALEPISRDQLNFPSPDDPLLPRRLRV